MENINPVFNTNSKNLTIDAGTSHIIFETMTSSGAGGLNYYTNQVFNNISFLGSLGSMTGDGSFNKVIFLGNGNINGNNQFEDLNFTAGKIYTLLKESTQTIENLILGE